MKARTTEHSNDYNISKSRKEGSICRDKDMLDGDSDCNVTMIGKGK